MATSSTLSLNNIDCLVFKLNGGTFALDVTKVSEIVEIPELTALPDSPEYFKGFYMLRDSLVTVLDLSAMMAESLSSSKLAIIVNSDRDKYGLIVDEALDVKSLTFEELSTVSNKYVKGICKGSDDLIQYIDCINLISNLNMPNKLVA